MHVKNLDVEFQGQTFFPFYSIPIMKLKLFQRTTDRNLTVFFEKSFLIIQRVGSNSDFMVLDA